MNIVMLTNTYLPHFGGVSQSIVRFSEVYRSRGHAVLVVAPEYDDAPDDEEGVVRLLSLRHISGSDFSLAIPVSAELRNRLDEFQPDLLHSHFPFFVGVTALRLAAEYGLPLVFTYHTRYGLYTHYGPLESEASRRFAAELATGYSNLCDRVIAPSESIREMLLERGVETPTAVIPTGVDLGRFAKGDGRRAREKWGIPRDAFVVGHVGRLAPEKNPIVLARALADCLRPKADSHALIVGSGRSQGDMRAVFDEAGVEQRLHMTGALVGQDLVDAYHATDCFVFASQSETQGVVLAEAAAAGCPLVALDAPGAREVVNDGENGRLVRENHRDALCEAIRWVEELDESERAKLVKEARRTAESFATEKCADEALDLYRDVLQETPRAARRDDGGWDSLRRRMQQEWELWRNRFNALGKAASAPEETESDT